VVALLGSKLVGHGFGGKSLVCKTQTNNYANVLTQGHQACLPLQKLLTQHWSLQQLILAEDPFYLTLQATCVLLDW